MSALHAELRKGSCKVLILSILRDQPLYGYLIAKQLDYRSGGYFDFREGTLYPALHKMETQGLLRSEWQVVDNGPSRKYYYMTEKGQRALAQSTQECITFTERLLAMLAPEASLAAG
jgi:PadR family transcriptional regulator PadR